MNMMMRMAVAAAVALLCVAAAAAAPDGRVGRKQQRPTRGFKNMEMMTARGFGKRTNARTELGMDNFWESLENTHDKDGPDSGEKTFDSIPLDWFVNEVVNNPDFARSVVRKFVDLNQDGVLSSDELLRNL